jgi:hypothetical protein
MRSRRQAEPLPPELFGLPGSACRFDLAGIKKLLD